jgi:CubicO group peptidase (beta-lactamase class C family)
MKHRIASLLAALAFVSGTVHAQVTAPPDEAPPRRLTESESDAARAAPPFRMFSAWLDAFNAADASRLREFSERHYPDGKNDVLRRLRDRTGGLDLRALEESAANRIAGVVRARDTDKFLRFNVIVEPREPDRIRSLEINYIAWPADFPLPRMTETEIFAALDARLAQDSAADKFSGVVLITKRGKAVYRAAHGLADREKNQPNDLYTRFNLGSLNKMFTATAIMQLVQAGKIRLSDPVGKHIPDYPNKDIAEKVTIEHLLTHTGGTGNIFGPEYDAHRLELRTHDDYLELYGSRGPAFEPGSRFEYSNYGPVLLGVIVEKVTQRDYDDYVSRRIFKRAGMKRTGSEPIDALRRNTAIGYMRAPEGGRKPNWEILARGTSAGGGYSTAGDLARFADALMGNRLLSAENTSTLITGKVDRPGNGRYAYGFEDRRKDGSGYVGHGGGAPGVNTFLQIFPQSGYVVVVLANVDPPAAQNIGDFVRLRLVHRVEDTTSSRP